MQMLWIANGSIKLNEITLVLSSAIKPVWWQEVFINNPGLTTTRPLVPWSNLQPLELFYHLPSHKNGPFDNWMFKMPSFMGISLRLSTYVNLQASLTNKNQTMSAYFTNPYTG